MTSYDDVIAESESHPCVSHTRGMQARLMPRTIVDIPLTQLHDLDARCASLGISRAEGVRRAIGAFLRDTAIVSAFGLWSAGGDARAREASAADEAG